MVKNMPNLIGIALRNTVQLLNSNNSNERQQAIELLREFYGDLPKELEYDLEAQVLSIQGEQNGSFINLPFTLVQETNAAYFYRLQTDLVFEKGIQFALVLTQPAPLDYPITLQQIVFQQGGTNV
jgi:hypothetical protein